MTHSPPETWEDLYETVERGDYVRLAARRRSLRRRTAPASEMRQSIERARSLFDAGASLYGSVSSVPAEIESDARHLLRQDGLHELEDHADNWFEKLDEDGYVDAGIWAHYKPDESQDLPHHGLKRHTAAEGVWTHSNPYESEELPHQGWKIHVAADAEDGKTLVEDVVRDYLQPENISHKVIRDPYTLNNKMVSGGSGKFLTIYPSVDNRLQNTVLRDEGQRFVEDDQEFNITSINANRKTTRELVKELETVLADSATGLYGGPRILSENGEERSYKETRIHYRYGGIGADAVIERPDGTVREVRKNYTDLINQDGEVVGGSYDSDQIDVLEDPIQELYQ